MGQPLPLRPDYDAPDLRALARRSKDAAQSRRLLALAAIYDGAARTEAAQPGSVTLQIVRDWVLRFNAEGPLGLIDRKAPGQRPRLNEAHRAALAAQIDRGPIPAVHGVMRRRLAPGAGTFTVWLSITPALGLASRPDRSRSSISAMSWMVRNNISRTNRPNHQYTVCHGGRSFASMRQPPAERAM